MRYKVTLQVCALAFLSTLVAAGCGGGGRPPVTEVEGIVLLNGTPLPSAQVEFLPELSKFGAEMNSSAITDDKGRFKLTCSYNQLPGAVIGKHRVTVSEAPAPQEFRGMDGASQEGYAKYVTGLRNRPIPPEYGTVGRTPLVIEVTPDKKDYEVKLIRR
jgi:hypothetical protein